MPKAKISNNDKVKKTKVKKEKLPHGRPTSYSDELADEICEALATSDKGIAALCLLNEHWPAVQTLRVWRIRNASFSSKYAEALKQRLAFDAEELEDLAASTEKYIDEKGVRRADPGLVAETRMKLDTRKWIVSKALPKVWGDKIIQEHINGDDPVSKLMEIVRDLHGKYKSDI